MKKKLRENKLSIGSWVSIGHPSVVEILATAGFDWMAVDLEHSSIDFQLCQLLIATMEAKGIFPFVRVGANDELIIKKVLDSGAKGIIVPRVDNAQLAQQAVDFAYYPPKGKRGVGLFRAQNYGIGFKEYAASLENELCVVAQLEHIDAVNNIQSILDVSGIDGFMIGPYDLSASMGYPGEYQRKDVMEAIESVVQTCIKHKRAVGFHVIESDPVHVKRRIDQGCTFIAYSLDFLHLGDHARAGMKEIREYLC